MNNPQHAIKAGPRDPQTGCRVQGDSRVLRVSSHATLALLGSLGDGAPPTTVEVVRRGPGAASLAGLRVLEQSRMGAGSRAARRAF